MELTEEVFSEEVKKLRRTIGSALTVLAGAVISTGGVVVKDSSIGIFGGVIMLAGALGLLYEGGQKERSSSENQERQVVSQ